jgi:hypothetical protein
VVFQQHPVFHCLMPALDLALGLQAEWRHMDMFHFLPFRPSRQIFGNVSEPIAAA